MQDLSVSPVLLLAMTFLSFIPFFFFFNDTATTEIYTLSLHDALPISSRWSPSRPIAATSAGCSAGKRSEEHTSELQSLRHLVCRLLLEKKKKMYISKEANKKKEKDKKNIIHCTHI